MPATATETVSPKEAREIARAFGVRSLLTLPTGNPKTAKSAAYGYSAAVLHLSPVDRARTGTNLCPHATPGCARACLNTAGRAGIRKAGERRSGIEKARDRRTRFFVREREAFLTLLRHEIAQHVNRARRAGLLPAVRLNGTSDVAWEDVDPGLFREFPAVQWYDYTKNPRRAVDSLTGRDWPSNYVLVLSWAETPAAQRNCKAFVALGGRIAVPFADPRPDTFLGAPVVDGDAHDAFFLWPRGTVLGLKPKGRARHDRTGFVVRAGRGS